MKLMIYIAGIIALAPFVLGFMVLAKVLRKRTAHDVGTIGEIGYDDNDPGVDVDCPAGQQICEPE